MLRQHACVAVAEANGLHAERAVEATSSAPVMYEAGSTSCGCVKRAPSMAQVRRDLNRFAQHCDRQLDNGESLVVIAASEESRIAASSCSCRSLTPIARLTAEPMSIQKDSRSGSTS